MGNKAWSLLFGAVMVACALSFVVAPFVGWWMPPGASSHAWDIDFLFYVIFYTTAFFFILTEAILVAFLWLYASTPEGKAPVSPNAEVAGFLKPLGGILNNQHRIEMAWTFVPAVILLYIAFAQVETWANIKYETRKKNQAEQGATGSLHVGVSARQFEWRMRYPSVERFQKWMDAKGNAKTDADSFGKVPQADDVHVVNELHLWEDHQITVHLSTRDVIHSFNLPNLRVKQDALPGKLVPVWFRAVDPHKKRKVYNCKFDESTQRFVDGINPDTGKEDNAFKYDIACAELCGWGHYRMIGRVFVHKDQADFLEWLKLAEKSNRQRTRD